jgi:hypothetical protein
MAARKKAPAKRRAAPVAAKVKTIVSSRTLISFKVNGKRERSFTVEVRKAEDDTQFVHNGALVVHVEADCGDGVELPALHALAIAEAMTTAANELLGK